MSQISVEGSSVPRGIVAEFETPAQAAEAARAARSEGFLQLEAYGPFGNAELAESIGFKEQLMAPTVLIGGIIGGVSGFALQYWISVIEYPHNIGGRPLNSWPAFIPVTFETTVLLCALTGIFSLFVYNRLPRLAHPVFSVPTFDRATQDHFFLCVVLEKSDLTEKAEQLLRKFSPISLIVVESGGWA